MNNSILKLSNVSVKLMNERKEKWLLENVSFDLNKSECLGIMGHSGSGKSLMIKSLLGLLGEHLEVSGQLEINGVSIDLRDKKALAKLRGREISVILQNPMNCFDPLYTIESQIKETIRTYESKSIKLDSNPIKLLEQVQIGDPESVLKRYPHELSGGMLQRIMIGLSLLNSPDVLIADEPTTAIDAINAKEIMTILSHIKRDQQISMIFISHDLSVISKISDKVIIVDQGKIIDQGSLAYIKNKSEVAQTRMMIDVKMELVQKYNQLLTGGGL